MPKYTVHNIPWLLKPEQVNNAPNFIFCLWHENLPLYFIAHPHFQRNHIWLTFPLWYMKPVHVMKKIIGVKELAYGASGHDGKKALKQVLDRLAMGWSTFLTPDGPKGPAKQLKNGVLLMSLKTGTPIIPMSFQVAGNWRINSWDRKRYPPFFSTLKVIYGQPITVTSENFDQLKIQLAKEMNDKTGLTKGTSIFPNV